MMNQVLIQQCEALIYMSGEEGITKASLAMIMMCAPQDIEACVDSLNARYSEHQSAFQIIETADSYKLVTVSAVHDILALHLQMKATSSLSNSALETLAIIAYRQPCTKSIIEQLRGVNVDMIVRKLVALDLIQEAGRENTPGRPILYEVTSHFLDVFHLASLQSLPTLKPIESEEKDLYVKSETA